MSLLKNRRYTGFGSFTAFRNGPGGQLFAVGGAILPARGQMALATVVNRCSIVGASVHPMVKSVVEGFELPEAADNGASMLALFASWLSWAAGSFKDVLWVEGRGAASFELDWSQLSEELWEASGYSIPLAVYAIDQVLDEFGYSGTKAKLSYMSTDAPGLHPHEVAIYKATLAQHAYAKRVATK